MPVAAERNHTGRAKVTRYLYTARPFCPYCERVMIARGKEGTATKFYCENQACPSPGFSHKMNRFRQPPPAV